MRRNRVGHCRNNPRANDSDEHRPHQHHRAPINGYDERHGQVEVHLDAQRPNMLGLRQHCVGRVVQRERQVAVELLCRHAVDDGNYRNIEIGERHDTREASCEEAHPVHVGRHPGNQEARQDEEQTHPHRTGRGIQLKRLGTEWQEVRGEDEQDTDCTQAVEPLDVGHVGMQRGAGRKTDGPACRSGSLARLHSSPPTLDLVLSEGSRPRDLQSRERRQSITAAA